MAKKPRTQVDYNPGQASLQGGVGASAGNYRVAVAPTPKTNAALQFASVINQLPNAAGQLTNYANKVATDRVSQMSDDEILQELSAGDKETFSILKYNKTFNYELVKRKYLMEQQNMANEYDALASDLGNNPDSADIDTAIANMESGLFNKFSGGMTNDLQMQAHKALWNATTTPLKAQAFSKYKALKEEATKMVIESNAMDTLFYTGDIQGELKGLDGQLNELGVSKKERMQRMMQLTKGYVDKLVFDGRFDAAQAAVDQAEAYEFFKGAELGGIGENKSKFMAMQTQIRRLREAVEDDEEETFSKKVSALRSGADSLMYRLHDDEPLDDYEIQGFGNLLTKLKPNITDKEIASYQDRLKVAEEKNVELRNIIQEVGTSGSDLTMRLFEQIDGPLSRTQSYLAQAHPDKFTGIDPDELKTEMPRITQKFRDNPNMSPRQAMTDLGYPGVKIPDEVFAAYNDERAGDWVKNTVQYRKLDDSITNALRAKVATIAGDTKKETFRAEANLFANQLLKSVSDGTLIKAKELKDAKDRDSKIDEWINERIEDEVRVFGALLEAPSIFTKFIDPEGRLEGSIYDFKGKKFFGDYEEGTKARELEKTVAEDLDLERVEGYEHLAVLTLKPKDFAKEHKGFQTEEVRDGLRSGPYLADKYKFMRDKIAEGSKEAEAALKITMMYYGYNEFDPKSAKDLDDAGLTFYDVKLFPTVESLSAKAKEWSEALSDRSGLSLLKKDKRKETLNAIDQLTSFGLSTPETIESFVDVQYNLLTSQN
tara:strand:+ start:261 stop:2573 length:2313 start_codon:yes stop_codon:yes gene_type:complete